MSVVSAAVYDGRKVLRHLWVNTLAGAPLTPRPLRKAMYRAAGLAVDTARVFWHVTITGPGLSVGRGTFINRDVYLDVGKGQIRIGRGCKIAPQVMIATATHELTDTGAGRDVYKDVTVGDRVWLGARAMVLPGVTICDGTTIAAGAVVTKDCLQTGTYAGIPAKLISGGQGVSDDLVPDTVSGGGHVAA